MREREHSDRLENAERLRCRICLESSEVEDLFRSPCGCKGDLSVVHVKCLDRWINSMPYSPHQCRKTCEICKKNYEFKSIAFFKKLIVSTANFNAPFYLWNKYAQCDSQHRLLLLFMVWTGHNLVEDEILMCIIFLIFYEMLDFFVHFTFGTNLYISFWPTEFQRIDTHKKLTSFLFVFLLLNFNGFLGCYAICVFIHFYFNTTKNSILFMTYFKENVMKKDKTIQLSYKKII